VTITDNVTSGAVHVPPDFSDNPHAFLSRLREAGPLHNVILPDGTPSWWVTSYDAVEAVLGDHERFSNEVHHAVTSSKVQNSGALIRKDPMLQLMMINRDPPDHFRMRKLVVRAFNARSVEALQPRLELMAEELMDAMDSDGPVDLVESFAFPFPLGIICELLGVPRSDRHYFGGLVTQLVGATAPGEALSAIHDLKEFMIALLAEKRANPSDDVLSNLVRAADEDGLLSKDELPAHAMLLLAAGHDTSLYLISGGLFHLLEHPGQLELIRRDPSLLPRAVDELLRYDPAPVPGVFRYATTDTEIDGTVIPEGSLVIASLAAANRDSCRFADPDSLNVTRESNPHFAFGGGIHYCLGARLARAEGLIAIGGLLRRFPEIRLAVPAEEIRHRPLNFLQRLRELPVLLH
jgi:6-deoxyerythronolide B hydroxylase